MKHRFFHILSTLAGLALIAFSIWLIQQQLSHFQLSEVLHEMTHLSPLRIACSIGLIFVDYLVLTQYDVAALHYVGAKLAYGKAALAAFLGHVFAVNTNMVLGSSVRYRLYVRWGLTMHDVTNVVLFCYFTFVIGFLAVGAVIFPFVRVVQTPLPYLRFIPLHWLGVIFAILLGGYLILNLSRTRTIKLWRWRIPPIPFDLAVRQIVVGFFDWMIAASAAYVLLPVQAQISYIGFVELFLVAQFLGQISQAPAGLGVFEATMILLLAPTIPSSVSIGPLLVFRIIYYLLPFAIGTAWFTMREVWARQATTA